jgi:hypothetical protein
MKEWLQKYRKTIIIIAIILLLLIMIGLSVYFIFFRNSNTEVSNDNQQTSKDVTPPPTYVLSDSSEAISITSTAAKQWSSDAKLYDCSGLTLSSVQYPDVTYYFQGADSGKFSSWLCTYYSKSKGMIKIFDYDEGELDDTEEAMEIGEYGYLTYDSVEYPSDLASIVNSSDIYNSTLELGLDLENNFVNMYLGDTVDYGFVWRVDEKSREEINEYGVNVVINTYIFDIYTGKSLGIITGEIY